MRHFRLQTLFFCLCIFIIAGCSADKVENNTPVNSANETESIEVSGGLLLYASANDTFLNDATNLFMKKYPEVKMEYFRSGTEEVIAKINAELTAGDVQADLIMLSDPPTFESLKSLDLLQPYEAQELDNIQEEFVDIEKMYYGTAIASTGIVYNTELVDKAPTGLEIFTSEEAKNNSVMPSPLYSGTAAYNLGIYTRTEGIGWDFYEKIKENGIKVVNGNGGVIDSVASGEKAYGLVLDSSAFPAMDNGSPLNFVYPKEGIVSIADPIAITKNTDNLEAAGKFIDFMLSEEIQTLLRETEGKTPVRVDMEIPERAMKLEDRNLLIEDPKELYQTREEDKEKFSTMFN